MYCEFYQLNERPFNVTPDPKFLYLNARYREAMAALQYGILQRKGFITLIGEAGTGKTTLLKRLLEELDPSVRTVFLFNTNVTFEEIIEYVFLELDLPVQSGKKLYMLQRLNAFLLDELSRGRNVALLIDEAQDLDIPVLEDLRLLSNLETAKEKILQIVLCGQPELGQKLSNPALRQLRQRIGINCRLLPLSREEVSEYIQFRLQAAGAPDQKLFTREAEEQIYHFSKGIPRLVNVVCDNALVIGYALGKKRIGADVIKEAAADLVPAETAEPSRTSARLETQTTGSARGQAENPSGNPFSWRRAVAVAGLLGAAAGGGWLAAQYGANLNQQLPGEEGGRPAPPVEVIRPGSLRNEPIGPGNQVASATGQQTEAEAEQRPRLAMLDDAAEDRPSQARVGQSATTAPDEETSSRELDLDFRERPRPLQEPASGSGTSENRGTQEEGEPGDPEQIGGAVSSGAAHGKLPGAQMGDASEEHGSKNLASSSSHLAVPVADESSAPQGRVQGQSRESSQKEAQRQAEGWEEASFTRLVVRAGDSLSGIARAKYGQSSYTILDLIKLANPEVTDVDWIVPGQTLRLPNLSEGLPIIRSDGGFALLVFSTPNPQRAQKLATVLKERGFDARVGQVGLSTNKKVHRVAVWGGSTHAEAALVGQALHKLLREDARVAQLGE